MSHSKTPSPQVTDFRQVAEGSAGKLKHVSEAELEGLDLDAVRRMMHELQVHEIELEMQNEELRRAQLELEASRDRYFNLYDLAPVGYATLDENGVILEANLAVMNLFGVPRSALVSARISRFVAAEHQDRFYLHRQAIRNEGDSHDCEIRMLRSDGTSVWVHLHCSMSRGVDDTPVWRLMMSDITRSIEMKRALETSEVFSSELIRSMLDGFSVIDSEGVAIDANPAFCKMTGFSMEELVGIGPPHPYWPPEEIPRITEALKTTLGGRAVSAELVFMRKNGERFKVLVSAFSVPDEKGDIVRFAATVQDITLRNQAEAAMRDWNRSLELRVSERTLELKLSEARFRQLAEATFEGVAISENGIMIDGNPQMAAMLGYDIAEMIGRPVTEFVARESLDLVNDRIRSDNEEPYECLALGKSGTKVPVEVKGRSMTWQGKLSRVSALRDLTAQKRAEAEHLARKEEIDKVMRLALVGEISAGIVHEISQPLSAVGANLAAAVNMKACRAEACDCMEIIEKVGLDIKRMRDSVNHLRALSNIGRPNRVTIDPSAVVSEVLLVVKGEAGLRDVVIRVRRDPEIAKVRADEIQIGHAMINLIRNAIESCADQPLGKRVVDITTRVVPEGMFELCVRDSGTGISPEVMKHMFSPFFTTKADGLGIGLRLSQTIVETHGGSITGFNNRDGDGATFRIVLPLEAGESCAKV